MCDLTKAVCMSAVLLAVGGVSTEALAGSTTVVADRDNTLYELDAGNSSNGAGDYIFAGKSGIGFVMRGLLRFDVAGAVPAGATIDSVSLKMNASRGLNFPQDISIHSVLADWGEGTSDAPGEEGGGATATAGDATWLHTFNPGSFWATAGGDFNPTADATTTVTGLGTVMWNSNPAMLAEVQDWLDNPGDNYGWLLQGDETANMTAVRFDSRENPDANFRPMLLVEYTSVPAPSALGLLAAGACIRRRRRLS